MLPRFLYVKVIFDEGYTYVGKTTSEGLLMSYLM